MRAGLLLAVLLLAACAGAPLPSSPPAGTPGGASPTPAIPSPATSAPTAPSATPSTSPDAPSSSPAAGGWRELLTGAWLPEDPFAVRAARDTDELDHLWRELGQAGSPPSVDFTSEMVLFLGMSGSSSCPERLDRLVVDFEAARVYGQWAAQDPNQACTDDLQAQGLLIAVDRALLPEVPFQLSLREQPVCPDCPEKPDQLIVDPAG